MTAPVMWRLLVGDVRDKLAELPDHSVQCVVTSPPYWGLRDYGTATWEGGDPECDHKKSVAASPTSCLGSGPDWHSKVREQGFVPFVGDCGKCGARRIDNQLGLEPTPDAYVQALVGVFREVWRVLADDGTVWLNLGDSYIGSGMTGGTDSKEGSAKRADRMFHGNRRDTVAGFKQKDLAGIPWRVAFALQADRWYLRSDVIWAKPNPMPESVTDRPTKSHEYIFLLSKSRRYYYNAAAIREPYAASTLREFTEGYQGTARKAYAGTGAQNASDVKRRIVDKQRGRGRRHAGFNDLWDAMPKDEQQATGSNCRSVWTLAPAQYPEAHFATFPEALPERCIKAGSKLGDLVLDPFCGSGTTGQVAIQLGRSFVGIELNPTYAALARTRIGGAAPLFAIETAQ